MHETDNADISVGLCTSLLVCDANMLWPNLPILRRTVLTVVYVPCQVFPSTIPTALKYSSLHLPQAIVDARWSYLWYLGIPLHPRYVVLYRL